MIKSPIRTLRTQWWLQKGLWVTFKHPTHKHTVAHLRVRPCASSVLVCGMFEATCYKVYTQAFNVLHVSPGLFIVLPSPSSPLLSLLLQRGSVYSISSTTQQRLAFHFTARQGAEFWMKLSVSRLGVDASCYKTLNYSVSRQSGSYVSDMNSSHIGYFRVLFRFQFY